MYSMTGYGRAEYKANGVDVLIEIKTVNNRNLDITTKIPRSFIAFDEVIRKCVQEKLKRGRVDLYMSFVDTRDSEVTLCVDNNLAKSYVETAKNLSLTYGIPNDLTATSLMRMADVLKETDAFTDYADLEEPIKNTVLSALDNLNEMRKVEGEKLKKDMLSRVDTIKETVDKISLRAPQVAIAYREKLTERIKEILQDVKFDESRLLTEVAVFTDKSNIDEELTRLNSHIAQFKTICEKESAGKQLDFLIQEFNRESNTICSKANDIEVTSLGLNLKCEIEKIREQVQNIE